MLEFEHHDVDFARPPEALGKFLAYQGATRGKIVGNIIAWCGANLGVGGTLVALHYVGISQVQPVSIHTIAAVAVFFGGAYLCWRPIQHRRHLTRLYRHGRAVSGRIINVESNWYSVRRHKYGRGKTAAVIDYAFEVADKRYEGTLVTYRVGASPLLIDRPCTVLYLPTNPAKHAMILGT